MMESPGKALLAVAGTLAFATCLAGGLASAQVPAVNPPPAPSPPPPPAPAAPTVTAGPCTDKPGCAIRTQTASFAFHSAEAGVSFSCSLRGPKLSRRGPCGIVQDWAAVQAAPATTTAAEIQTRVQAFVPPGRTGTAAMAVATALQTEAAPLPGAAQGDASTEAGWATGAVDPHEPPSAGTPGAATGAPKTVGDSLLPAVAEVIAALQGWWTPTLPETGTPNPQPAQDMAGALVGAVSGWEATAPQPGGWSGDVPGPVAAAAQGDATTVQAWTPGEPQPGDLTTDDAAGGVPGAVTTGAGGDAGDAGAWADGKPAAPTPDAAVAVAQALVDGVGDPSVDTPDGTPEVPTGEVDVVKTAAGTVQSAATTDAAAAVAFATNPADVDTTPPATTVDDAASAAATAATATITVASKDLPAAEAADQAALTPAAPAVAVPPDTSSGGTYAVKDLGEGRYTFTVVAQRAAAAAGENAQADSVNQSAPVTYVWFVDRTAPAAPTLKAKPDASTSATDAHFEFVGGPDIEGEPAGTFACSVDHQTAAPCGAVFDLHGVAVGAHELQVVETDAAGNKGAPRTFGWTVVPPPSSGLAPVRNPGGAPIGGSSPAPQEISWPTTVANVAGKVLVTRPGEQQLAVSAGQSLPSGAKVDARRGSVTVTVTAGKATQRVTLAGARFVYRLQGRTVAVTLVQAGTLRLAGRGCRCRVSTPDAVVLGAGSVSWLTTLSLRGTAVRASAGRVDVEKRGGCSARPVALSAARRSIFVSRKARHPGRC